MGVAGRVLATDAIIGAYLRLEHLGGWDEQENLAFPGPGGHPGGGEMRKLADGFKGPADFCAVPQAGGLTVVVPELVQSQLRIIQLRN